MPTLLDEDGKYKRFEKIANWLERIHSLKEWIQVDAKFEAAKRNRQK